ncbi:MAG: hypothetical protein ACREJP_08695, partial [Candidatus Methylomirabilales bacterium]
MFRSLLASLATKFSSLFASLAAKIAAGALVATTATGSLAIAGTLPATVQRAVSNAAQAVHITLPSPAQVSA